MTTTTIRNKTTATTISTSDWLILETVNGTFKFSTASFLNKLDATSIIAGDNIKATVANNTVTLTGISIWYIIGIYASAPSVATSGKRYYNSTSNLIFTSNGSSWGAGVAPASDALYLNTSNSFLYYYTGTTLSEVLTRIKTDKVFTVNSGYINETTHLPDLMAIDVGATNILHFKVNSSYGYLSATTALGDKFTITSISDYDVSSLTNGTYKVLLDINGTITLTKNTLSVGSTIPNSPVSGDYWLNTVASPYKLQRYTTSWIDVSNQFVQIGTVVISSGALTSVTTNEYNIAH